MASNSELLDLYSSLRRNISLEASSFLKEIGFSLRQFLILRNLGLRGPMTMTSLAEVCMTDAATVSRSIAQLIDEQYVRKLQCPTDGRVWRAELAPKGQRLMPELQRIHGNLAEFCFSPLSGDEKKNLARMLRMVVDSLEEKRLPSPAKEAV